MSHQFTRRKLGQRATAVVMAAAGATTTASRLSAQSTQGIPIYLDYDQAGLDAAYDQGNWASNIDRVMARRDAAIERALSRLGRPLRIEYGPSRFERLDWYRTDSSNAPIHIFIHGGAWREGGGFGSAAYLAEAFVRSGAHFVSPDYVLVQDAQGSLFPMVEQLRRAVAWVYENASSMGGDRNRIYISGHSAGGHLAGVVLVTDWRRQFGLPEDILKGGLCSSGMYDLYPVSLSARRQYVAFTPEMVEALSPLRDLDRLTSPVIVSFGTSESPEFQRQSREFADALVRLGRPVELVAGEGYNHFEIIETLANPFGLLGHAALSQMGLL